MHETMVQMGSGAKAVDLLVDKPDRIHCVKCDYCIDVSVIKPFTEVSCPGCGRVLTVPAQLNQFRLVKILGRGKMGRVFQAVDGVLQREVAIKVLTVAVGEGPERLACCLEEARALAALNHHNVVQVHAVEEKDGQPFIVMELVAGDALDKMIASQAPLDEARALEIAIGVAYGLRAARGVGLIHADVKPANILLDGEGAVKLVDFGIARVTGSGVGDQSYGTPQYVAPEVVRKRTMDHRCDIFSLGATLFHMLAGRPPFLGDTVEEVLRARLSDSPEDLRSVRRSLHVETAAVVSQMLQIDPDLRYLTYDELIEALSGALGAARYSPSEPNVLDLDDALQTSKTVRRRRLPHHKAGKRPLILMIMAVIVLGGWIGGALWWSARQKAAIADYKLSLNELPPPTWMDLLHRVAIDRDTIEGRWSLEKGGLALAASPAGRLSIPTALGQNYQAKIVFSCGRTVDRIGVFFPVGYHQAMLQISGTAQYESGLQWINEQKVEQNGTGVDPVLLVKGRSYTLDIRVRLQDEQARVDVSIQGKPYVSWSGPWAALDVLDPWSQLDPDSLGLGAVGSDVVFEQIKVLRKQQAALASDR